VNKLYKLLNLILKPLGFSLIRNELRADLPSLIRRLQKAGVELQVIYDVGAYKGKWTEGLKPHLKKDAHFFLFEPNSKFDSELRGTGFPVFKVLLSDKTEMKKFYSQEGSGDSYYPEKSVGNSAVIEMQVQATTLDELFSIASNELLLPDLMKIDTQGSEIDILKGSTRVVEDLKVLILECPIVKYNQGAPNIQEYLDFVIKLGFVPFQVIEIHILNNAFVQIDIAFISTKVFNTHFGNIDLEGFWQSTREYYGI
jgi:FkbM family methyltransferase